MNEPVVQVAATDTAAATATVVKGGNILYTIKAHVVCRDPAGNVRWEDDAIAQVVVPAGDPVPEFHVEGLQLMPVEGHRWE